MSRTNKASVTNTRCSTVNTDCFTNSTWQHPCRRRLHQHPPVVWCSAADWLPTGDLAGRQTSPLDQGSTRRCCSPSLLCPNQDANERSDANWCLITAMIVLTLWLFIANIITATIICVYEVSQVVVFKCRQHIEAVEENVHVDRTCATSYSL